MHKLALVAVFACLTACSGSFTGKVAGKELQVQDALFFPYRYNNQTVGATFILADKANVCTSLKANRVPKNSAFIAVTLFRVTSSGALVPPDVGDYTMTTSLNPGTGNFGYGQFNSLDTNCNNTVPDTANYASSGLVKVGGYKPDANGSMSGTFDITWGSQNDKTNGSYNAIYCDLANNFPESPNCE